MRDGCHIMTSLSLTSAPEASHISSHATIRTCDRSTVCCSVLVFAAEERIGLEWMAVLLANIIQKSSNQLHH